MLKTISPSLPRAVINKSRLKWSLSYRTQRPRMFWSRLEEAVAYVPIVTYDMCLSLHAYECIA